MKPQTQLDKVTVRDWALAAIGLLFVLASLIIMGRDFKGGLVTGVFFGACFAHAASVIVRKRRLQKRGPVVATVTGGVPIRQSRGRIAGMGSVLLGIGITQVAFGGVINPLMVGIGWLLLAVGGGLLIGLAAGVLPVGFIQFDPDGITFAHWRGKVVVPWHAITGLARGEVYDNPAVLITVDTNAVMPQPEAYRTRLFRQMAFSRGTMGGDFAILTSNYGIDAPVLLAALQRYLAEPAARKELQATPRLTR